MRFYGGSGGGRQGGFGVRQEVRRNHPPTPYTSRGDQGAKALRDLLYSHAEIPSASSGVGGFGYTRFVLCYFCLATNVLLPLLNPPVRAHIQPKPAHGPSGGPRNVWGLGDDTRQSCGVFCVCFSFTPAALLLAAAMRRLFGGGQRTGPATDLSKICYKYVG